MHKFLKFLIYVGKDILLWLVTIAIVGAYVGGLIYLVSKFGFELFFLGMVSVVVVALVGLKICLMWISFSKTYKE